MKILNVTLWTSFILSSAARAEITELVWPLGENVCIGTWSFNEIKPCNVPDYDHPLYEGEAVYPTKSRTCGKWAFGENVIDSKEMNIGVNSRSSVHDYTSLLDWCNYQARPTKVNSGDLSFWHEDKYEPDNVTQKWVLREARVDGDTGTCRLDLVDQPIKQDPLCGAEPDYEHPTRAFSGYAQKSVYALSCGTEARTLTYGSSMNPVLGLDNTDKASAVCSTSDGAQLDTDADIQAKAVVLNREMLAALRLDSSTCAYKLILAEYTRLFLKQKASRVPGSQQSFLTSVSNLLAKKCSN